MKKVLTRLKNLLEQLRLLPTYSEDTIFLLALAVVAALLIDEQARAYAVMVADSSSKLALVSLLGIGFAFYTAFFSLFKNEIQKFYMFWFAVAANFISAVAVPDLLHGAGSSPIYYVAPILNIGIAAVLMLFWYADVIDTSTIPHRSSSYTNLLYGTLVLLAITGLCAYVFNLPWPVTISLSVAYASLFNRSLVAYLPKIFTGRDERLDTIDALSGKLVGHLRDSLNAGEPVAAAIATQESLKDVAVGDDDDIDALLNDEARTLLGQKSIVATGAIGYYTYKRFWFTPERSKTAVIVDVYEQGIEQGHRFSQMLDVDEDDVFSLYKGMIYIGKINGI